MVGKSEGLKMFETSRSVVGSGYKLGGQSKKEGLDCLSMLHVFFEKAGINLPKEWNGYKYDEYEKLFVEREDWKDLYLNYLKSIGETVQIEYAVPGDIAIIRNKNGELVSGIITGNGQVIVVSQYGIRPWPTKVFNIVEVIRVCHQQFHT